MTTSDTTKFAAATDATFKMAGGSSYIAGLGALDEVVRSKGLQITLDGVIESVKALDNTALKTVGGALAGGAVGGPLAAAVLGLSVLTHSMLGGNDQKTDGKLEDAGHGLTNNTKGNSKIGFPFFK